ncbi:MAG: hypothetical protein QM652_10610 [Legionella sp.]|uniref:hypothetical protein n=1 Tax=Legionella sp. TaxID=459 RepID=UPI0039E5817A
MSDTKSKIPDFKELASMSGKLFNDIKTSIGQIIQDYKDLRAQSGINDDGTEEVKAETPKTTKKDKPEEEQK